MMRLKVTEGFRPEETKRMYELYYQFYTQLNGPVLLGKLYDDNKACTNANLELIKQKGQNPSSQTVFKDGEKKSKLRTILESLFGKFESPNHFDKFQDDFGDSKLMLLRLFNASGETLAVSTFVKDAQTGEIHVADIIVDERYSANDMLDEKGETVNFKKYAINKMLDWYEEIASEFKSSKITLEVPWFDAAYQGIAMDRKYQFPKSAMVNNPDRYKTYNVVKQLQRNTGEQGGWARCRKQGSKQD